MTRKHLMLSALVMACASTAWPAGQIALAVETPAIDRTDAKFAAPAAEKRNGPAGRLGVKTFMVPMSDGKKLATDAYVPPGDGPFPVILLRTPYNRTKGSALTMAATLIPRGYVFVSQDMRGRFASEGENMPFIGCGWGEHKDGVDTIEWLLKQPWCNGKIGTTGASASGITQSLLAGAAPPRGLVAQYIQVGSPSSYQYACYIGGALVKSQAVGWTDSNAFDPLALQNLLAHPCYDDSWRAVDTTLKFGVMNVPAIHFGGWFDTFEQGTIDSFRGRQHHGAPGALGTQKLVIGPWDHGGWKKETVGDLTFRNSAAPKQYDSMRWFDFHLKGIDDGMMKEPAVCYFVMGDTSDPKAPGNEWRTATDWPIPATDTSFYFAKDGGLADHKPLASEPAFVQYTFDAAKPCPTIGGRNLTIARGPQNQNPLESRPDVVTFTTPPLTKPTEVTGQLLAKLFVSSSAADTDMSVRLCDVYPDGKSYLFSEGMLRLRYRNSFEKPEPLPKDQIVPVTVDCWSTSLIFNKGHRIRVTVTSSNYPRFDVNPGTGQPGSEKGPSVKQTNRIYCDAEHPSCMILPVVAQGGAEKK